MLANLRENFDLSPSEAELFETIASQHAHEFLDGDFCSYFARTCCLVAEHLDTNVLWAALTCRDQTTPEALNTRLLVLELLLESKRAPEIPNTPLANCTLDQLFNQLKRQKAADIPSDKRSLDTQIKAFAPDELSRANDFQTLKSDLKRVLEIENECQFLTLRQLAERAKVAQLRFEKGQSEWKDLLALCAYGRLGLWAHFRKYPTSIQTLTIVSMLRSCNAQYRGLIAQMRTGEGKSICGALLALCLAGQGKCVDVVSSSRYLARRDGENFAPFFDQFGISTSHICQDHPPSKSFDAQILYGTNSDFEFAYLRESLQTEPLRQWTRQDKLCQREFHAAIVDEIDNLLIDTALNVSRIAMPSRGGRSWVYAPIWAFVKWHSEEVRQALASSGAPLTALLAKVRAELARATNRTPEEIQKLTCTEQLTQWLHSALVALFDKQIERDYIVRKSSTKPGIAKEQVLIVEQETGRVHESSRWKGGLHEFLEIKHDIPPLEESLTPASIDHATYFQKYQMLFGLTGTLGSREERGEIHTLQRVTACEIPPYRPRKFTQLPPLVVAASQHASALIDEIRAVQNKERPVLLLFGNIEETLWFSKQLEPLKIEHQMLNEVQEVDENWIISKAGLPRQVTLATNTAGRGTDILLSPKSLSNGGLHVIFAHYPVSDRVEEQGLGRAARQGQPGSGRLILSDKDLAFGWQGSPRSAETHNSTPESCVERLDESRRSQVQELSQRRLQSAALGTIQHEYFTAFAKQLRCWEKDLCNAHLLNLALKWQQRSPAPPDIAKSARSRHEIPPPCMKIGDSQSSNDILQNLQKAREDLKDLIQQIWAENFYEKLGDLADCASGRNPVSTLENYRKRAHMEYLKKSAGWLKVLNDPQTTFEKYYWQL